MKCEFEERQYEEPLNRELGQKRKIFDVGQFLENTLGMDSAMFSKHAGFWRLWNVRGHVDWKKGVQLRPEVWDFTGKIMNDDKFPKFKCNLFIQCKRPEHISSPAGKEYRHWRQPYFRYDLTGHQQDTLSKLEAKISSSAIVVYACSSFWRLRELWRFYRSRKLVENSNFIQPRRLKGHDRYTFIKSGNVGKAFSNPSSIKSVVLLEEIDKMLDSEIEWKSNTDFILTLSKTIVEVVYESNEETGEDFFSILQSFATPEHELGRSFANIFVFNLLNNLSWRISYT